MGRIEIRVIAVVQVKRGQDVMTLLDEFYLDGRCVSDGKAMVPSAPMRGQRQGPASRAVFRLGGRGANAIGDGLYIRSIGAVHETHQTGEDCQYERESQWLVHKCFDQIHPEIDHLYPLANE